ncbi:DUF433 domain-containing protein [Spongiactinospora sp. 9N601]|uniref:DUF433 domain-containing protein n=1 Tax=Spongiactinospora sp. 9N601 TaxID=3375149 RepID=UPI0037BB8BF9
MQRIRQALDKLPDELREREHHLAESGQAADLALGKANVVVHDLIDVLRPFRHDGRYIPDLLRPRRHVTVDPSIRGGIPVVEGTRVPYDEVATLLRDGVPAEHITEYYPGITAAGALDAADFADHVDAMSR